VSGRDRPVIVTADHFQSSLAAVRALRSAGYLPWVAVASPGTYAERSRAPVGRTRVPDPEIDPGAFVAALVEIANRIEAVAVLPSSEDALVALAHRSDRFPESTSVGVPDREIVDRATDKALVKVIASEVGLSTPESVVITYGEVDSVLANVPLPAVVKPVRTHTPLTNGTLQFAAVRRVDSRAELRQAIQDLPGDRWIVERYVSGPLVSIAGVAWNGDLVSAVHQVADRVYPREGGGCYIRTIPRDGALEDGVARLVRSLHWSGPFHAQFIGSGTKARLIDFNPRIYGSLSLAVAAGHNIPAIWLGCLLGRVPVVPPYRSGVRYRAEERDVRALWKVLQDGAPATALKGALPRRSTTHAVFSLRDPAPILTSAGKVLRYVRSRFGLSPPAGKGGGATPRRDR
jgi:predicted ATP-grasp superfamily ATP-dependent carboligase